MTEQGDWEGWLLFVLAAVEETARWTTGRILAIRELFEATAARCRQELPRRVYSRELMELIFAQPYVRIQTVMDAGLARRDTASDLFRSWFVDFDPVREKMQRKAAKAQGRKEGQGDFFASLRPGGFALSSEIADLFPARLIAGGNRGRLSS